MASKPDYTSTTTEHYILGLEEKANLKHGRTLINTAGYINLPQLQAKWWITISGFKTSFHVKPYSTVSRSAIIRCTLLVTSNHKQFTQQNNISTVKDELVFDITVHPKVISEYSLSYDQFLRMTILEMFLDVKVETFLEDYNPLFLPLLNNPKLNDTTILYGDDQELKVSKVILCHASSYFSKLLSGGNWSDSSTPVIDLKEFNPCAVLISAMYMYTNVADISWLSDKCAEYFTFSKYDTCDMVFWNEVYLLVKYLDLRELALNVNEHLTSLLDRDMDSLSPHKILDEPNGAHRVSDGVYYQRIM